MYGGKLTTAFCVLACILWVGCSDEDGKEKEPEPIRPLIFEKEAYEIRENLITELYALSCNGYNVLDVESGDTARMKANVVIYENGTSHASGCIYLTGVQKGNTSLTVRDRLTQESKTLDIKVVDLHLGMKVTDSDHPLFTASGFGYLFLVGNGQQDFYLFSVKDDCPDRMIGRGNFAFSVESEKPCLTLTVAGENDSSTSYRFDLSGNNQRVYTLLSHYFRLGWETAEQTFSKSVDQSIRFRMTEGGKEVFLMFDHVQLPDGFLK